MGLNNLFVFILGRKSMQEVGNYTYANKLNETNNYTFQSILNSSSYPVFAKVQMTMSVSGKFTEFARKFRYYLSGNPYTDCNCTTTYSCSAFDKWAAAILIINYYALPAFLQRFTRLQSAH